MRKEKIKNTVLKILTALGFFILWIALIEISSYMPDPSFTAVNDAVKRLWWEFVPCLLTLILTVFFTRVIHKGKIKVSIWNSPLKSLAVGICFGIIWIGVCVGILYLFGVISFDGRNEIGNIPVWIAAVLLNVIMQEYLMRGYIFQLLWKRVNCAAAVIVSTLLFTAMHGGAFEAGAVAVLNVITMSVFVSLLLIYTGSLLAPVIVHFIWNTVGGVVLGGVSLADDYPSILNCTFSGNVLLTGGFAKIEGSLVVLAVNLILIAAVFFLKKKQNKRFSAG